jgi:S1-C subfamily serine protease
MAKYRNNSGFGVLGSLLLLAAVGTLGLAGWHIYRSGHKAKAPASQVSRHFTLDTKAKAKVLTLNDFQSIISNDKASVVKVEGAYGCGDVESFGTGFVVAPGLVATNAHVVAGYTTSYVHDGNGRHVATPVLFDATMDFAALRVSGLAGNPLPLNVSSPGINVLGSQNGNQDLVLGYPNGGSLTPVLASVSDEYDAPTYDIYGNDKDAIMMQLKTDIIPGNSGSPLLQKNGSITGMIFGTAPGDGTTGYAIPTHIFSTDVQKAKAEHTAVTTGVCISGSE